MSEPNHPSDADCNRREFLGNSARNAVAVGVIGLGMTTQGGGEVRVGVIGLGQQGRDLASRVCRIPGVSITAVCDVDVRAIAKTMEELRSHQSTAPVVVAAHEALLERNDVDAVIVATPDHWHADMVVSACRAGKDVYVEQPASHTIEELDAMQSAIDEHRRIVQTALPQRSGAHYRSAVEQIQSGTIGAVHLVKAWSTHKRSSIGRYAPSSVPMGVDYDRWLGAATNRPFQANRFHRHWPHFWDYGSGELGLWGVQLLDVARWGLELELPQQVTAIGGQRHFQDDRETPDTMTVHYQYPNVDVIWEHRQWTHHGIENRATATAFYGDRGTLVIDRSGWKIYDHDQQLFADASEIKTAHLQNWIDCCRTRIEPSASLKRVCSSVAMCHLGNLAFREGRAMIPGEK